MNSKEIIVEIKGIGFPNKGAELMLVAIIEEFKKRGVNAKFAAEPYGDYELRSGFSLYQIARVRKFNVDIGKVISLLPNKLLKVFGIIKPQDIDVVLDASGFSYGDQWGPELINYRLGTTISKLKARGAKVIVLPQALGPFLDDDVKKVSTHIFNNADIVYARDNVSYKHLCSLGEGIAKSQCSDFTNTVSGLEFEHYDKSKHQICIIPNSKMIEKTNSGDNYIDLMVKLLKESVALGEKPFLLIHEGKKDRALAEEILRRTECDIDILEPIHPLKIKWVIGQSKFTISSRFHGLVSALSQGKPVIATGWSHKYKCLLQDYNVEHSLFDVDIQQIEAIDFLNKIITEPSFYQCESEGIKNKSIELKKKVNEMWDEVFTLIK